VHKVTTVSALRRTDGADSRSGRCAISGVDDGSVEPAMSGRGRGRCEVVFGVRGWQ
jgi:hypothetical protein